MRTSSLVSCVLIAATAAAQEPRSASVVSHVPIAAPHASTALATHARDVAARAPTNDSCVAALEAFAEAWSNPTNQLARFASANYVVLAEVIAEAVADPSVAGALGAAVASGYITDFGDASTCQSLPGFRYYVATTPSNSPALGLCLPKACSAKDLEGLLREATKNAGPLAAALPSVVRSGDFKFRLDAVGYGWLGMAAVFVVLAVAATCAEPAVRRGVRALAEPKRSSNPDEYSGSSADPDTYSLLEEEEAPAYAGPEWLRCFSLRRNAAAWAARRGGALSCLDGVRVVSMLLVVYGHSIIWGMQGAGYSNIFDILPTDGEGLLATPRGQVIYSAELAVDSFFWLSGFLAAYVTSKVAGLMAARVWVPAAVVHRYLRLTPVYMFVVVGWWKVLRVAGEGALWESLDYEYDLCAKWWWTNLLYVNNLVPFHEPAGCYGVTWYLPNDMQFFLLLPLFVLLHRRSPRAGYAALLLGGLASMVYAWWATIQFDLKIGIASGMDYSLDYYMRPWTRIPPYLVGAATALAYRDAGGRDVVSPRGHTALLLFGLLVAGLAFFGVYPFNQDITEEGVPHWKHVWYITLSKPAWAVALSCLCWPCFYGRGSLIAFCLELPIWEPVAKLTFLMYLLHPAVLDLFFKSNNTQRVTFDEYWWYVVVAGTSCLVAAAALVVHLLVELPCANVMALLLPSRKGAAGRKAPPPVLADDDAPGGPLTRGDSAEIV